MNRRILGLTSKTALNLCELSVPGGEKYGLMSVFFSCNPNKRSHHDSELT